LALPFAFHFAGFAGFVGLWPTPRSLEPRSFVLICSFASLAFASLLVEQRLIIARATSKCSQKNTSAAALGRSLGWHKPSQRKTPTFAVHFASFSRTLQHLLFI
jgi:hypothetical protein